MRVGCYRARGRRRHRHPPLRGDQPAGWKASRSSPPGTAPRRSPRPSPSGPTWCCLMSGCPAWTATPSALASAPMPGWPLSRWSSSPPATARRRSRQRAGRGGRLLGQAVSARHAARPGQDSALLALGDRLTLPRGPVPLGSGAARSWRPAARQSRRGQVGHPFGHSAGRNQTEPLVTGRT
jgi:hypothetical protein